MPEALVLRFPQRTLMSLDVCDRRRLDPHIFIALKTSLLEFGSRSTLLAHLQHFLPQSIKRDEYGLYVFFADTVIGRDSAAKCYRSIIDFPYHGFKLVVKYRENGFSLREQLLRYDQQLRELSSPLKNGSLPSPPRGPSPIASVSMNTADRMDSFDFRRNPSHVLSATPDQEV